MDLGLKNRVALVTGASRGIGRACAEALEAEGARVAAADLQGKWKADISDEGEVGELVRRVAEELGSVDILVNNAGVGFSSRWPDVTTEEWDQTMAVNLRGAFLCTRAVFPIMKEKGWGRVVNIASTAGKTVSTLGGAHYTASKHGVLGLTRAFAKEAAGFGVTCNAVCPGLIDTEMVRGIIDEKKAREYGESFPIPRLGKPSEVGALVAFLASEQAAYITGAAVDITGGDLMV